MSKPRFPPILEKGKCRGCGKPVPPRRQTWCSTECCRAHHPGIARELVKQRDKGVCANCGVDTARLERRLPAPWTGPPEPKRYHPKFRPNGINSPFDRERYDRALTIRNKRTRQWRIAADKRREAYRKAGWPTNPCRHFWEADHIIPHSEGGTYELSNMRTLCILCHKARTRLWHKARKAVKKADQLELIGKGI